MSPKMRPMILITIEGALIQSVESTIPLRVIQVDFDTEGAEEEDVHKSIDGKDCWLGVYDAKVDEENVMKNWIHFRPRP